METPLDRWIGRGWTLQVAVFGWSWLTVVFENREATVLKPFLLEQPLALKARETGRGVRFGETRAAGDVDQVVVQRRQALRVPCECVQIGL